MKTVYKIAQNEWRYLFYSPIAWFVIIVFLIECAIYFVDPVCSMANWQEILLKNSPQFKGTPMLTFKIFITGGVFQNVINNLYLFIPILTMGLVNREVNNGSIRLLYSSPVRLRYIVLGKYLGIVLYNLLLVAILGIFMVAGAIGIRQVDYGMLLSAALGFYLLVCAYSAIGLFMSSLSTYAIVSALSTFVVIFVLGHIDSLWQRYDFVRDLTWFLSLQNRTARMLRGLIVTRDVIYFVIVTALFVGFTLIKLRAGREDRPWYIKAGRYAMVMAIALLLGYISSRPGLTGYLDTTATQSNTIPKEMQGLLKRMKDSTLEVTLYTNLLGPGLGRGLPEARNADYLATMWEPYLRFKPDIQFKYEYYYDTDAQGTDSAIYKGYPGKTLEQIASENATAIDADLSLFKSPEQMHRSIDLQPEGYRLVMRLKYRGRTEFLRTFEDPLFWPDLTNVSAACKRLLDPDKIPKVYFASGELERSIYKTGEREYAGHTAAKINRGSLVNMGFDADTLHLATQPVPPDIAALVLADPKTDLPPAVQRQLENFADTGGNLFITGEPGKQYVLDPFLARLGVRLMNGQLVEPTFDETPEKVYAYATAASGNLYKGLSSVGAALESKEDTAKVLLPGVTGIDFSGDHFRDQSAVHPDSASYYGNQSADHPDPAAHYDGRQFVIKPLLMTCPGMTWLKAGELIIDSTLPPFNPAAGDIRQRSFSTAIQMTRPIGHTSQNGHREQRIIICGDADFASNLRVGVNGFFVIPVYSWLTYNEFPVYMTREASKDNFLRIGLAVANAQKQVFLWVVPGLVLLIATIILIRRKRK